MERNCVSIVQVELVLLRLATLFLSIVSRAVLLDVAYLACSAMRHLMLCEFVREISINFHGYAVIHPSVRCVTQLETREMNEA